MEGRLVERYALEDIAYECVHAPCRKPHLQGRFSGRLATKEDERRLAEECKVLGPLLGGVGKRGDKSRLTLAKIVRGIATGDIRRFCEERERLIQVFTSTSAISAAAQVHLCMILRYQGTNVAHNLVMCTWQYFAYPVPPPCLICLHADAQEPLGCCGSQWSHHSTGAGATGEQPAA